MLEHWNRLKDVIGTIEIADMEYWNKEMDDIEKHLNKFDQKNSKKLTILNYVIPNLEKLYDDIFNKAQFSFVGQDNIDRINTAITKSYKFSRNHYRKRNDEQRKKLFEQAEILSEFSKSNDFIFEKALKLISTDTSNFKEKDEIPKFMKQITDTFCLIQMDIITLIGTESYQICCYNIKKWIYIARIARNKYPDLSNKITSIGNAIFEYLIDPSSNLNWLYTFDQLTYENVVNFPEKFDLSLKRIMDDLYSGIIKEQLDTSYKKKLYYRLINLPILPNVDKNDKERNKLIDDIIYHCSIDIDETFKPTTENLSLLEYMQRSTFFCHKFEYCSIHTFSYYRYLDKIKTVIPKSKYLDILNELRDMYKLKLSKKKKKINLNINQLTFEELKTKLNYKDIAKVIKKIYEEIDLSEQNQIKNENFEKNDYTIVKNLLELLSDNNRNILKKENGFYQISYDYAIILNEFLNDTRCGKEFFNHLKKLKKEVDKLKSNYIVKEVNYNECSEYELYFLPIIHNLVAELNSENIISDFDEINIELTYELLTHSVYQNFKNYIMLTINKYEKVRSIDDSVLAICLEIDELLFQILLYFDRIFFSDMKMIFSNDNPVLTLFNKLKQLFFNECTEEMYNILLIRNEKIMFNNIKTMITLIKKLI